MMNKLIAMRNNLGHGHKGDIIITTQERLDKNFPPVAKDIVNEAFAMAIVDAYNSVNVKNDFETPKCLGITYDKNETIECFNCTEKFIITPEESKLWDTTCKKCGSGLVMRIEKENNDK